MNCLKYLLTRFKFGAILWSQSNTTRMEFIGVYTKQRRKSMKNIKRTLAVLISLIMVCTALTGCGKDGETQKDVQDASGSNHVTSDTKTTDAPAPGKELKADIVYWSSYTETSNYGQVIAEAAQAFMKENPGVKIDISFQGTDIQSTLGPAIEAGTKITMFEANTDASMNLWKDKMIDLAEYYNTVYPQTNGEVYGKAIIDAYNKLALLQGDGVYMYFPYTPQFVKVLYNKDIFDACGITSEPSTWDEFMAVCDKLVAKGYIPFTSDQTHIHFSFGYYLQRTLGDAGIKALVYSTDGTEWQDAKVLEAAKVFQTMASKGYFAPNINTVVSPEAQQEMVIDQKIAMYVAGSWMPNNLRESAGPDFHWGSFNYPVTDASVDDGSSLCYGGYGISINKAATKEEADAAAAFAVYLTLGKWGDTIVETCNAIPISKNGEWPPMIAEFSDTYDGITNRWTAQTAFALNNDLLPVVKSALTKLMAGTATAEDFIAEILAYYGK